MKYTAANLKKLQKRVAAYRATAIPRDDSGGRHTYRTTKHSLPSASEILSTFAVSDFVERNPEIMAEAAHIGKAVHAEIDFVMGGKKPDWSDMVREDVRYQSCMDAFYKWKDSCKLDLVASELELVSRFCRCGKESEDDERECTCQGYGGTIDGLFFIDGVLTLLDYKTGAIQFKNFLQLELYAMLVQDCLKIKVDRVILVELKKTGGEYRVRECPDRKQSKAFAKHLLTTYACLQEFKTLVDGRRKMII